MTKKSATERLREMLDERGEDYISDQHSVTWAYYADPHTATESMDGTLIVTGLTPEQVIAAALDGDDKSRWHELFGTPERAARTICRQLKHYNICTCDGCPVKPPNKECDSEYDALLEWLRGDAE